MCKSCKTTTADIIFTILTLAGIVLTIGAIVLVLKRRKKRSQAPDNNPNPNKLTFVKRFKNGLKIIFNGLQIVTTLPTVAPLITFPPTFRSIVSETAKVFRVDIFSSVPMGCLTDGGFNFYDRLLATTLFILIVCLLLFYSGLRSREKRAMFFNAAIAITYLTLPTVTTTIFGAFQCDGFDDGTIHLHADLSIDCKAGDRWFWQAHGVLMVLIFAVGVTSLYFYLVWKNLAAIMEPVEVRSNNEQPKKLRFLFDPYKPGEKLRGAKRRALRTL